MKYQDSLTCCKIVICSNDGVQIGLHQLKNNIDVLEARCVRRKHNVLYINYIRVLEDAQKLDLPQDSGRVSHIVEHVLNPLDCNLLSRLLVYSCANSPIAAAGANGSVRRE